MARRHPHPRQIERLGGGLLARIAPLCCTNGVPLPANARFEIRGLHTTAEENEYATAFREEATLVAAGDSVTTHKPYLVVVRIEHLSEGDSELTHATEYESVTVSDGAGQFYRYGGSRAKATSYQRPRHGSLKKSPSPSWVTFHCTPHRRRQRGCPKRRHPQRCQVGARRGRPHRADSRHDQAEF
jgi:hypothetical protein